MWLLNMSCSSCSPTISSPHLLQVCESLGLKYRGGHGGQLSRPHVKFRRMLAGGAETRSLRCDGAGMCAVGPTSGYSLPEGWVRKPAGGLPSRCRGGFSRKGDGTFGGSGVPMQSESVRRGRWLAGGWKLFRMTRADGVGRPDSLPVGGVCP